MARKTKKFNIKKNFIFKCLDKPDWKALRLHLQREGRISKEDLIKIVNDTNKIISIKIHLFLLN